MGTCSSKKDAAKSVDPTTSAPSEATIMKKKELKSVIEADGRKRELKTGVYRDNANGSTTLLFQSNTPGRGTQPPLVPFRIGLEEGDAWYIVEAAWVQRWLAYVQGGDWARAPGAIDNLSLLHLNQETRVWEPKPLLRAARKEHMGHYRRVNEDVWRLWSRQYRGSGPAITVTTAPLEDSSNWTVSPAFMERIAAGDSPRKATARASAAAAEEAAAAEAAERDGRKAGRGSGRLWPSSLGTLGVGEMEDEGVGFDAKAKAAAFFDAHLESPSASLAANGSAAATATARASSAARQGSSGARTAGAAAAGGEDKTQASEGGDGVEKLQRSATEWVYGSSASRLME